jgi:hypothetical protein
LNGVASLTCPIALVKGNFSESKTKADEALYALGLCLAAKAAISGHHD